VTPLPSPTGTSAPLLTQTPLVQKSGFVFFGRNHS
jgi:hypothetical protein